LKHFLLFRTELQPAARDETRRTSTTRDGDCSKEEEVDGDESAAPSATVLQCVINNSDSQTSRYCQYTMPVVCSVNTQQVMSSTPYLQASSSTLQQSHTEEVIEAPEVMLGAEEIIVITTSDGDDIDIACCEIESTPLSDNEDDDSADDDEVAAVRASSPLKRSSPTPMGPPLPKKKRPLPKELLETCMRDDNEEDEECFPGCFDVSMEEEDEDDDDDEDYASKLRRSSLEDYNVTPPSTMTLQSMTSTSVSTSCRPKVLVQVTDSARYHQLNTWNRMYMQPSSHHQQQPKLHHQPSASVATPGLLY